MRELFEDIADIISDIVVFVVIAVIVVGGIYVGFGVS